MNDFHHDCAPCHNCGRHLDQTEQWPCLTCQLMLCADCDCTQPHLLEVCS